MKTKPIFIHIPKTGGTSINCMMQGSHWQTSPDYHYRHIIYETKKSNCGDIFQAENFDKYKNEFIFMMLRHPVDRLVSEYYFLRKHQEFMRLLQPHPKNFEEFVRLEQSANYMLKFLDGRVMYDNVVLSETRANEIMDAVEILDIHVGIFEEFDHSLTYFSEVGGFQWPQRVEIKRATLNRPKLNEVKDSIKEIIAKKNQLDLFFYHRFHNKLLAKTSHLVISKFKHIGGKYEHVIPYTTRFCILEIALNNHRFIEVNKSFLATLNVYLHKTVSNGRDYAIEWVKHFKKAVLRFYPDTQFAKNIEAINGNSPLENIVSIANIIDDVISDESLCFDVNQPLLQLIMSADMVAVFRQAGLIK